MTPGAVFPNRPTSALLARAQRALGMTHRQFGDVLGASERTSLRWARGSASVGIVELQKLAALVHPRDPQLARELAEASNATLESLEIVAPPPPPSPPVPPPQPAAPEKAPLAPHLVADLVVCAAADAIGSAPGVARVALRAAFKRAKEMGVSVAEVERALADQVATATEP